MKVVALLGILAVMLLADPVAADLRSAGAQFLEIPYSARSSGMGEVGVVLYDETALTNNPAAVAFSTNELGSYLTLNPVQSPIFGGYFDDERSNLWSLQFGIPGSAISAGFYRNGASYGTTSRTDESGTLLEPYTPHEESYNLVVGIYQDQTIDYALGATLRYIHSDLAPLGFLPSGNATANAVAGDFGAIVRIPFQMPSAKREATPDYAVWYTATFGAAITNVGPDFGYGSSNYGLPKDPLPTVFGGGLALEIAGVKDINANRRRQWSLLLAGEIEVELPDENATNYKLGIEAGIMEAVFLRAGRLDLERETDAINTFGFSVSLRRILEVFGGREEVSSDAPSSTGDYLMQHLDIRCNAAFYTDNDEVLRYDREVIGISVGLVP